MQAGVGVREGIAGTMHDGKTGQVMPGGVKQVNFVKESVHTDPDKFIIDFNSIKETPTLAISGDYFSLNNLILH